MTDTVQSAETTDYVLFSDDLERRRADEDELIKKIADSLHGNSKWAFKKYKHGIRDAPGHDYVGITRLGRCLPVFHARCSGHGLRRTLLGVRPKECVMTAETAPGPAGATGGPAEPGVAGKSGRQAAPIAWSGTGSGSRW